MVEDPAKRILLRRIAKVEDNIVRIEEQHVRVECTLGNLKKNNMLRARTEVMVVVMDEC